MLKSIFKSSAPSVASSETIPMLRGTTLLAAMLLASASVFAADPPATTLTPEEQKQADAFDTAGLLAKKEADAIAAQTALAKAKVAAVTPAAADGVTAPSGVVTGANNMTFAMYMLSLDGLQRIAQAICNDLDKQGIKEAYTSGKDVAEAVAKDEAYRRARDQLAVKLTATTTQAKQMKSAIDGTEAGGNKISAASLAAVASGIDIATGLVKGAAGLASLFKSERKIEASDNLLGATEVSASLSMCRAEPPALAASPRLVNVDGDLKTLSAVIGSVSNEVKNISDLAAGLDAALNELATAADKLDRERKSAEEAKDKAKLASLDARKPLNYSSFTTQAAALVTKAQAYVDAMYQVDSTSGLSPLIVSAQFRELREAATSAGAKNRIVFTLLRSSGYTLTTKRLLLNDRVDYAGGVAIRASVFDASGVAVYDRIFFRDSGWIRADFDSTGGTILRQNF